MKPAKAKVAAAAFWLWAVVLLAAVSSLMVGHWYTLPRPDRADESVTRAMASLRLPGEESRWLAVHLLYTECRCSRAILDHLTSTRRPSGVVEKVVLVGDDPSVEGRLRDAGFAVVAIGKAELERRFHVVSAPLLAVVAPDDTLRYLGGYTERKQGPDIRDRALIEEARSRGDAAALPLFGCPVSDELRSLLDPLGLKG